MDVEHVVDVAGALVGELDYGPVGLGFSEAFVGAVYHCAEFVGEGGSGGGEVGEAGGRFGTAVGHCAENGVVVVDAVEL